MQPSKARNSSAQPCTSPTANTVSPFRSKGAGFQPAISTGSLADVSMAPMLSLSGAPLHRCRGRLGSTALELFLDDAVQVEAHRHLVRPLDPDVRRQRVVAVADALHADTRVTQHAPVALDDLFQPADGGAGIVVGRPGIVQRDPRCVVAAGHAHDLAPQLAVGDDDACVIVVVDLGVEEIDDAGRAGDAASLDAIAD